jgi:hypothetical protein
VSNTCAAEISKACLPIAATTNPVPQLCHRPSRLTATTGRTTFWISSLSSLGINDGWVINHLQNPRPSSFRLAKIPEESWFRFRPCQHPEQRHPARNAWRVSTVPDIDPACAATICCRVYRACSACSSFSARSSDPRTPALRASANRGVKHKTYCARMAIIDDSTPA